MNAIALDRPRYATRSAGLWARIVPSLAGLLFVASFVALFFTPAGADTGETPDEVVAYATANQDWILAGLFWALGTIVLLASFVSGLCARLREFAAPGERMLVAIGGTILTLCFALAWVVWLAPLGDMPDDPARAALQAETYLAVDEIGWLLLGSAGIGAALMALAATRAAMRAEVIPVWLAWLGLTAGVAAFATVAFLGLFGWLVWIAGASIVMLVGRRSA